MTAVGNLTGDVATFTAVQKEGVTLHNFPTVLATNIADISAVVNDASQSGKRLGGQLMAVDSLTSPTAATIYVSAGDKPDSPWVVVKQVIGTGSTDVTPA